MSFTSYEDLVVYKAARQLAITIHKITLAWPKMEQYGGMADQLRRSSKSICANLAEGLSKNMSVPDKCKFIQIALGSAEETRVWLDFAFELSYIEQKDCIKLRSDYSDVCRMLNGLRSSIRKSNTSNKHE